jgi:hypothetical protein
VETAAEKRKKRTKRIRLKLKPPQKILAFDGRGGKEHLD